MSDAYASTNWYPTDGREQEFADRWREALTWTRENFAGLERARLLRDRNDPGHFVSFIEWQDEQSLDAWREHAEFGTRYAALQELCRRDEGSTYTEEVKVA